MIPSTSKRSLRAAAAFAALSMPAAVLADARSAAAYTVPAGSVFNDPEGGHDQQYAIMNRIEANIDAVPKGSVIRASLYSLNLSDLVTKLKAAHDRGVHVRILMDDHAPTSLWTDLAKNLNNHADGKDSKGEYYSFARLCHNGCLTGFSGAAEHAKYYLFSTSGTSKKVVMVTSANPTDTQAEVGWNAAETVVGNSTLYDAYVGYFYGMTQGQKGHHQPDFYSTHKTSGAYFWPKARTKSDTFVDFLNSVTPKGAVIRIAMFEWTAGRIAVANKLVAMGKAGAKITILYAGDAVDSTIKSALRNKTGITVLDSAKNTDGDPTADHYTHSKYMLLDGVYNGVARKYVWSGSSNFTINGIYHNDETDLKFGGSDYTAFLSNFNAQVGAAAPTSTAKKSAELRGEGESPDIPIKPSELIDS